MPTVIRRLPMHNPLLCRQIMDINIKNPPERIPNGRLLMLHGVDLTVECYNHHPNALSVAPN